MTAAESTSWLEFSPADFDRRRVAKGYRPAEPEQCSLFFMAAPTAPAKPARVPDELPGQDALDLFGGEDL